MKLELEIQKQVNWGLCRVILRTITGRHLCGITCGADKPFLLFADAMEFRSNKTSGQPRRIRVSLHGAEVAVFHEGLAARAVLRWLHDIKLPTLESVGGDCKGCGGQVTARGSQYCDDCVPF